MAEENKNEDAEDVTDVSEDATESGGDADKEQDSSKEKKSGGKLKIILFAGIPVLLILIAAGVIFFTSFGRQLVGLEVEGDVEAVEEEVVELPENITYYEMPELLVNIQTNSSKRKPYLRLAVKFEVHDPEHIQTLDLLKPRIIDSFQVYLRELRVDDLEGSAGSQRLKEELLKRVNAVSAPAKVMDVLFQVFVVQ